MRIVDIRIQNYKSFADSQPIELAPGMNVIVGVNNSGKSALLEAVSLGFQNRPFRGSNQGRFYSREEQSIVDLTVSAAAADIREAIQRKLVRSIPLSGSAASISDAMHRLQELLSVENFKFRFRRDGNGNSSGIALEGQHPFFGPPESYIVENSIAIDPRSGTISAIPDGHRNEKTLQNFCGALSSQFAGQVYGFRAERLNLGVSTGSAETLLKTDASNLPAVLLVLQTGRPAQWSRFVECVRVIFPDIAYVSVRPQQQTSNHFEIVIWSVDTPLDRGDLAIPLADSGTGIGQVLAILYVLLSSESPRCIVIDEPNSFLHPGAAKKLMRMLRDHGDHQYVVSTHSPEIIKSADPDKLLRVKRDSTGSVVLAFGTDSIHQQREVLSELGVSLGDVFGADSILWVEGPTERECFPRILRHFDRTALLGTSIVAMHATSDFEKKRVNSATVFRLYSTLSQGNSLIPPAIAFVFDAERRTRGEIEDLKRESRGAARFLARCMYENYLLNPAAITAVLNRLPTFADQKVTEATVSAWFAEHGTDVKRGGYKATGKPLEDATWVVKVDGAKLLSNLFSDLSKAAEKYEKVTHGLVLTNWLLEHTPDALREVADTIVSNAPEKGS